MSAFTKEAKAACTIFTNVAHPQAQVLFYQCLFQVDLFSILSAKLTEEMRELNFRNFARTQTSHMIEGLFGEDIHAAHMETAHQKVMGLLGATISAGHKTLRAMNNARRRDGGSEWRKTKPLVEKLEEEYRVARNACEHLDESIYKGTTTTMEDFSFSRFYVFRFRPEKAPRNVREFDFSSESLKRVPDLWWMTFEIIGNRKATQ